MNHSVVVLAIILSASAGPSLGQVSSGGIYSIEGRFAKADAPVMSGGHFSVENGAFSSVLIVETPEAPTMKIQYEGASVVVTWSGVIDAFQLEQTAVIGTAWSALAATQQSAGSEIKVTIPVGSQNQFLRLRKAAP